MTQLAQKLAKSLAMGFATTAIAQIIAVSLEENGVIKQEHAAKTKEIIGLAFELLVLDFPLWFKSTIVSKLIQALIKQLGGNQLLGTIAEKLTKFSMINELSYQNISQAAAYGLGGKLVAWTPLMYGKNAPVKQDKPTDVLTSSPK